MILSLCSAGWELADCEEEGPVSGLLGLHVLECIAVVEKADVMVLGLVGLGCH